MRGKKTGLPRDVVTLVGSLSITYILCNFNFKIVISGRKLLGFLEFGIEKKDEKEAKIMRKSHERQEKKNDS